MGGGTVETFQTSGAAHFPSPYHPLETPAMDIELSIPVMVLSFRVARPVHDHLSELKARTIRSGNVKCGPLVLPQEDIACRTVPIRFALASRPGWRRLGPSRVQGDGFRPATNGC